MAEVIRMCAGCRERVPAPELVRLVWLDGRVVADPLRRLPGRGVNVHAGCGLLVLRNRGIQRGLRHEVDGAQLRDLLAGLPGPTGTAATPGSAGERAD